MGKIKTIYNRIYADYLMPSRLNEYEDIIKKSIEQGYTHLTIEDYYLRLKTNTLEDKKYFIHRHDIDSDLRTTRKMFEIEKKYGIKTTAYFRLSTIDISLMREMNEYGSEASYHFEEIASYCKRNKINSREEAISVLSEISKEFTTNFKNLEEKLGYKLKTVASHGDFVNRKLKLINNEITNSKELRDEIGLACESYDKDLQDSFDAYISDKPYPVFYSPQSIFEAIDKNRIICMLTHPRQWETNFWVNTKDNLLRFYEGLIF